jgi:hypothetical protein
LPTYLPNLRLAFLQTLRTGFIPSSQSASILRLDFTGNQNFKGEKMFKHIVFRIVAAVVLLAAIAGIAGFAFNAGVARGAALNLQVPATAAGQPIPYYGYGMPFMHPMPFGFGFLGLLLPLFLIFLAFGAARRMLWGPRWGGRHFAHMHGMGSEKHPDSADFVPPMFAEWHRRSHGQAEQPKEPADQK